ncbi:MAG: hypothetical protein GDA44_12350 [Prochloron sp. SP5CPC1]|nr:hypothetical protein [Candidatus Paraprochloron terpiosi SP5CPC1]
MKKRITVFIEHHDDDTDFLFMESWIKKWADLIYIQDYSTGGWEHCWDLEAPAEAIEEIPEDWLCDSVWAGIGKGNLKRQ